MRAEVDELPPQWTRHCLGDVATLQRGMDLPVQDRFVGDVPVYGSNGIDGWHNTTQLKGPGVITGRSGSIGHVYFEPSAFWPLNTTLYVKDFHGNEPRFVSRLLRWFQLERFVASTGVPSLNRNFVHPQPVHLPPLQEQRRIAEILDTLDTTIRQTEATIEKLKKVKQGLLHDLLTRGIDANGELRPPQSQAPHLYKDSPLGWIPREWALLPIESLSSEVTSGARDWARFYAESGATFVRIGNLTREHINFRFESLVFVRPPTSGEGQRTKLLAGDILISITADLGIIGVVPAALGEAYINQHIAMVRVDQERADSRFLGHFLSGHAAQRHIANLNDSGAKAGLNLPTIRGLPVAAPTRCEQEGIARQLDSVDLRVMAAQSELSKLAMLKSGLMDDLLTGRVRVPPLLA